MNVSNITLINNHKNTSVNYNVECRLCTFPLNNLEDAKELLFTTTPFINLQNYNGTIVNDNLKTSAAILYTRESLFVGFTSQFESLKPDNNCTATLHNEKTYSLWELEDVVELFIGPDARRIKEYREFQVSPFSKKIDIAIKFIENKPVADYEWLSGFKAKSWIDNKNKVWYSIMEIPFSAFAKIPVNGETWDCNFFRCSPDMKILFSWAPVYKPAFHQPDKFGKITFIE